MKVKPRMSTLLGLAVEAEAGAVTLLLKSGGHTNKEQRLQATVAAPPLATCVDERLVVPTGHAANV